MNSFLRHATALTAIGLVFSLIVHVLGMLGIKPPLGYAAFVLQTGAFLAAFGALMSIVTLLSSKGEAFWRAALRACPKWIKWMTYFFVGYAVFNLIVFLHLFGNRTSEMPPDRTMALVFRGFSGEWMAFYSASFLIFYSANQKTEQDARRG